VNLKSVYKFECVCGNPVETSDEVSQCGKCNKILDVRGWRAEAKDSKEPKTVSERYEAGK
jgi:hypothetical protein